MDVTARFVELVAQPESDLVLDEPALLIAAHDHHVDVAAGLGELDALADEIAGVARGNGTAALARALFVERGFTGNTADYTDPRNSFLDEVLRRRLGIPITLSVVMIEVGRRLGVECRGIGMPGHFLVGSDDGFVDPFHRGAVLDRAGARRLFEQLHPDAVFLDRYLDPVGPRTILARMLANLVRSFSVRDPSSLRWALRLQLAIPDRPEGERREDSRMLRSLDARWN